MKIKFKTWWLLLAVGILLAAVGVFALLNPLHAFLKGVNYAGLALFANAIILILFANNSNNKAEKFWLAAESVNDLFFAALLVFNPIFTFLILPLVMGGWMICMGCIKILAALNLKGKISGWVPVLITGIVIFTCGILVSTDPLQKANGGVIIFGAFCLLLGALNIFDAVRFKKSVDALSLMF